MARDDHSRYHHGDLRNALMDAAETLLEERKMGGVTITAVTQAVGVSGPAFYRHFKDLDDLYGHVAARGFDRLAAKFDDVRAVHPIGSIEAMVAAGAAYIAFGVKQPELFHLMWGATRKRFDHEVAQEHAACGYQKFIGMLEELKVGQGLEHIETYELGTPMWGMVHGLASLAIGGNDFVDARPEALHGLVDAATRSYLAGLQPKPVC